jgi:hypothetical protein
VGNGAYVGGGLTFTPLLDARLRAFATSPIYCAMCFGAGPRRIATRLRDKMPRTPLTLNVVALGPGGTISCGMVDMIEQANMGGRTL